MSRSLARYGIYKIACARVKKLGGSKEVRLRGDYQETKKEVVARRGVDEPTWVLTFLAESAVSDARVRSAVMIKVWLRRKQRNDSRRRIRTTPARRSESEFLFGHDIICGTHAKDLRLFCFVRFFYLKTRARRVPDIPLGST